MAENVIGTDISPPDLRAKITGRARYAEDFRAEGMVFAKLLLSPMPHARVRSVDTSAAEAMEGVLGILRADELPVQSEGLREGALTDEPKYEGEPILAVAAVDETTAAAAVEAIRVDFEQLPFVLDPLESLREGGPDAHVGGNISAGRGEFGSLKWPASVFEEAGADRLPMGEPATEWTLGDIEAGFDEADVVVEETIVHQSVTHHPMEPRSCMAYWQNGKLFLHGSTQSTERTRGSVAGLAGVEPDDVVFIGEYCGGGFGSKISGSPIMAVPAVLSRKIGRPVMLRITRYEENYIGRARAGFQGWAKMGFRADGRMTALDLYLVQDSGPFNASDLFTAGTVATASYQPENMRFRGAAILTNTPPRSAQRAPGGAQIVAMLEPLVDKAARELDVDRLEIRKINAPGHDGWLGARQTPFTSAYVREALDLGGELFGWEEKKQLSGQRNGTKVTGVGMGLSPFTAGSAGRDGLLVIRPDGKLYVHQGIGNLGTHSIADTARPAADVLDLSWDQVEIVWGDTSKHLPFSTVQAGSQTTHAHTRANHAAGTAMLGLLQELAARELGGSPADYRVADGRVFRAGNRAAGMNFAEAARRAIAAGGKFSGGVVPEDLNDATKAAVAGLAGEGLIAAARDNYSRGGSVYTWVATFAQVELDVETGEVEIIDLASTTDCGTVMHPRSLAAQTNGGVFQGIGMAKGQRWVFDPKWGIPFTKRFYTARPPGILDVPLSPRFAAVNEPDPHTPVGAKGIGEPPVGAGEAAYVCAVADAMGGLCLCRTPLTADMILAELEGRPRPYGLLETHV
ncbi:MAG: xanthine dehydrogenase family protein molybdopterin-binding subunit [Gemmatimonadetes bacterium]|nr:xanthine dehydrogenase family protein molybdopterin-binding subunit [Gemmatimonadota bacterium]MYA11642.1 xanthine dehydrogenase family protein molybdopterin-binding subunit [Gemmatimonadota bacterium]MYD14706.1 xanthine dehydrogenase family protein molybdopterin-binding subunit [Gemmatimonadota bacterium]MYE71081.1 xanthine dehydrogenase family protein molybdopterin-binding subunit [Gemmatimonadota bacterium]MYI65672.1 xanthine dehydrogenase family protein molybdopterin-binding subunit [Gem